MNLFFARQILSPKKNLFFRQTNPFPKIEPFFLQKKTHRKLYYKNGIKIDRAGIAVFANYEVPDLDLIEPENPNPTH
jgi:hypothetical protein